MKHIENPVGYRLWVMRRMLGSPDGQSPVDTVQAWYRDAAERSMRLRGFVPESLWNQARADLIELAGYLPAEADGWIYRGAERYPLAAPEDFIPTPKQVFFKQVRGELGPAPELRLAQ